MSATASPGDAFCPTCEASFPAGTARCPTDGTALVTLHTPADPMLGRDLDGRYTLKSVHAPEAGCELDGVFANGFE